MVFFFIFIEIFYSFFGFLWFVYLYNGRIGFCSGLMNIEKGWSYFYCWLFVVYDGGI